MCKDAKLRSELVDVQMHPVKMLLFVKFKTEQARNHVNERVQSPGGTDSRNEEHPNFQGFERRPKLIFFPLSG